MFEASDRLLYMSPLGSAVSRSEKYYVWIEGEERPKETGLGRSHFCSLWPVLGRRNASACANGGTESAKIWGSWRPATGFWGVQGGAAR